MIDPIDRQAAIDAFDCCELTPDGGIDANDAREILEQLPSAQPETCEGCKHFGKWENEVEYGYPSPCTRCKRRVNDYYER